MSTIRTPSAVYHSTIPFMSNGEVITQTRLNNPMYKLQDNDAYLVEQLGLSSSRNEALASVLGESLSSTITAPVWSSTEYVTPGASHHDAIEALDANLAAVSAATDLTRVDNLDLYILGEDSSSPSPPDWSTLRSPFAFLVDDTHHDAIEKLDIEASVLHGYYGDHESRLTLLESYSTIADLASAQAAISSQQVELDAVSVIVFANASVIDTLDSVLTFTRTETSTIGSELTSVSTMTSTNSCILTKMMSQINLLRGQHAFAPITTWCP